METLVGKIYHTPEYGAHALDDPKRSHDGVLVEIKKDYSGILSYPEQNFRSISSKSFASTVKTRVFLL